MANRLIEDARAWGFGAGAMVYENTSKAVEDARPVERGGAFAQRMHGHESAPDCPDLWAEYLVDNARYWSRA